MQLLTDIILKGAAATCQGVIAILIMALYIKLWIRFNTTYEDKPPVAINQLTAVCGRLLDNIKALTLNMPQTRIRYASACNAEIIILI